jgi:hypothetical protein
MELGSKCGVSSILGSWMSPMGEEDCSVVPHPLFHPSYWAWLLSTMDNHSVVLRESPASCLLPWMDLSYYCSNFPFPSFQGPLILISYSFLMVCPLHCDVTFVLYFPASIMVLYIFVFWRTF